jgi:hypothetical protein
VDEKDGFKIIVDNDEGAISIDGLSVTELDRMLGEELVCDDITDFQNGLLKKLKDAKKDCHKSSCVLQETILKEIIIIKRLVYWIEILSSTCDRTPN